jgi:hypothetical protein
VALGALLQAAGGMRGQELRAVVGPAGVAVEHAQCQQRVDLRA